MRKKKIIDVRDAFESCPAREIRAATITRIGVEPFVKLFFTFDDGQKANKIASLSDYPNANLVRIVDALQPGRRSSSLQLDLDPESILDSLSPLLGRRVALKVHRDPRSDYWRVEDILPLDPKSGSEDDSTEWN